jgi:hypothetical protein
MADTPRMQRGPSHRGGESRPWDDRSGRSAGLCDRGERGCDIRAAGRLPIAGRLDSPSSCRTCSARVEGRRTDTAARTDPQLPWPWLCRPQLRGNGSGRWRITAGASDASSAVATTVQPSRGVLIVAPPRCGARRRRAARRPLAAHLRRRTRTLLRPMSHSHPASRIPHPASRIAHSASPTRQPICSASSMMIPSGPRT